MMTSLILFTGCQMKEKKIEKKATESDNALVYTFNIENHDYRFRLLDDWIKFPNTDGNITFLVGNKEIKSFMTAGVEPITESLESYKNNFLDKLTASQAQVKVEPEKRELNGLSTYYLRFVMNDQKNRPLSYNTYLIETDDYFINLAAWTSEEKPSDKTLSILDEMLANFEQIKQIK